MTTNEKGELFFNEFRALARPGGRLIVSDNNLPEPPDLGKVRMQISGQVDHWPGPGPGPGRILESKHCCHEGGFGVLCRGPANQVATTLREVPEQLEAWVMLGLEVLKVSKAPGPRALESTKRTHQVELLKP